MTLEKPFPAAALDDWIQGVPEIGDGCEHCGDGCDPGWQCSVCKAVFCGKPECLDKHSCPYTKDDAADDKQESEATE